MQSPTDEELDLPQTDSQQTCGRPDCVCALPVNERFILWALRQWRSELSGWREGRTLPPEGSALLRGFQLAGLLDVLPAFANLMDALLFGARRALEIHDPACSCLGGDEATLIALCALAQLDRDGPLLVTLDAMMVPAASPAAAMRLKTFAVELAEAGLRLSPPGGAAAAQLH